MRLPDRLGFRGKTLWDWLQLLVVPAILIGVTFAWSATQTQSDNKREDRRSQDATLQAYLDQMSGLMLREKLATTDQLSPVRAVARTVTLAALRRLDAERKAEVLLFLYEADLLNTYVPDERITSPVIWLQGTADLSGADLRRASLPGAELSGVDLTGADLSGSVLNAAHLVFSRLRHAQLSRAKLDKTDLTGADLTGADLSFARFTDTDLGGAHLKDANLTGAQDLAHAKFVSNTETLGHLLAHDLDLDGVITALPRNERREFLDAQKKFLDSLSPPDLAKFNLTPEKLAKFRREANGG